LILFLSFSTSPLRFVTLSSFHPLATSLFLSLRHSFALSQFRNFSSSLRPNFTPSSPSRQGWERQRPATKANVEQAGESDKGATHQPLRNMAFGIGTKADSP